MTILMAILNLVKRQPEIVDAPIIWIYSTFRSEWYHVSELKLAGFSAGVERFQIVGTLDYVYDDQLIY